MGIQIQVPLTPGLTTPWSHEQLVGTNGILGTIISQLPFETKNSVRCMSLTQCTAVTNEARAPEYNPVSSRPKLSPTGHEFSISYQQSRSYYSHPYPAPAILSPVLTIFMMWRVRGLTASPARLGSRSAFFPGFRKHPARGQTQRAVRSVSTIVITAALPFLVAVEGGGATLQQDPSQWETSIGGPFGLH